MRLCVECYILDYGSRVGSILRSVRRAENPEEEKAMLAVVVLSIVVPVGAAIAAFAGRSRLSDAFSDVRGIALQTVIVMVVLLAIAGAIAAVLLTRGGEAVSDVERQQISRTAGDYNSEALCEAAGFRWDTAASPDVCKS